MTIKDFVIIGGGIAGLSAIKAIREENASKSILWVNGEDRIPYKRTQINKNITKGFAKEEFALIDHDWLVDNHIELLFDLVDEIDTEKQELAFKHRGHLRFGKLIISTGNTPKSLTVDDLPEEKVIHVHTARQVENIIRSTSKSKKYLVIGAGVEGVETADQLNQLGKEVSIVDRNQHVLKRYFTPKYSQFIESKINAAGIELYLSATELKFKEGDYGRSIVIIDGKEIEFDTIISAIGYEPNITIAQKANIKCNKGILVNEFLQTSSANIYAAGDVAEHKGGEITGLWHAAEHQGKIAGQNALGKNITFALEPFRMKTEIFGEFYFSVVPMPADHEIISEEKGEITRDLYFNNNKLVAALMKNDKARAQVYQKALLEQWTQEQVKKELPL